MYEAVELSAQELVDGRLFTHPHHVYYDRRVLEYMVKRLGKVIDVLTRLEETTRHALVQQVEPDQREHRIILGPAWQMPRHVDHALAVVGFFGQKRFDGDTGLINTRDRLLAQEMENHPGLISYSSLELTNGDYANCVLFVDEAAKMHWGTSPLHAQIATELSPRYYYSVRLYNGALTGCPSQSPTLQLTCAKYYDYACQPAWRAAPAGCTRAQTVTGIIC
ncbi:MAG: hypothetical protein R2911_07255 [Caldilineaceae bacterium]